MEALVAKMKEYLSMDTEIDFAEFDQYYQSLIEHLNKHYQELAEEELLKVRYILNTVAANADGRALRKDKNLKKYRKIEDKTKFWADAISYKMTKEMGYTKESLEEADVRIDEEMRPEA